MVAVPRARIERYPSGPARRRAPSRSRARTSHAEGDIPMSKRHGIVRLTGEGPKHEAVIDSYPNRALSAAVSRLGALIVIFLAFAAACADSTGLTETGVDSRSSIPGLMVSAPVPGPSPASGALAADGRRSRDRCCRGRRRECGLHLLGSGVGAKRLAGHHPTRGVGPIRRGRRRERWLRSGCDFRVLRRHADRRGPGHIG